MSNPILATAACLGAALLAAPAEVLAQARDWVEYKSKHFTLYTDTTAQQALDHLESFEAFRLVALAMLGVNDEPEPVQPLIMLFESPKDWRSVQPDPRIAGFFHNSIFGPRMFIAPQASVEDARGVLFHEYVHYLMDRHSRVNYPRWFSEGYAELLAGVRIDDETVLVGLPNEAMRKTFAQGGALRVSNVIDLEFDQGFDFYMTSWILVHYLLLESVPNIERWQQTLAYLQRFDAGDDPVAAFEQTFGTTAREMDRALNAYKGRNALATLTLKRVPYEGGIERRALSADEALYRLGDVAVEHDQVDAAYRYFNDLEDLKLDSPLQMKARSRRAIGLVHQGRVDRGDALLAPLIASGIDDVDVLADVAHYAFDRAVFERDKKRAPDEHLARSIEYGKRAAAANPLDVEAHFYLGLAHELAGRLPEAVAALLDAYELNQSDSRLNRNLARVLIKSNELEAGVQLIGRLYSASHSDEYRAKLKKLEEAVLSGTVGEDDFDGVLR